MKDLLFEKECFLMSVGIRKVLKSGKGINRELSQGMNLQRHSPLGPKEKKEVLCCTVEIS